MASSLIHMAVANEINKTLNMDNNKLLIGSISPDISKLIGETKQKSHFITENNDIPNIELFLKKYKKDIKDDFVMGYFIHLYTDYLWFKYFIPEVLNSNKTIITKLDGTKVNCTENMAIMYIYNDYTNLNIQILDKYNMNLEIFNNKIPKMNNIIKEIPMEKLNILINKVYTILENTKSHKDMIFNIENITNFIELSRKLTLSKIEEILNNKE